MPANQERIAAVLRAFEGGERARDFRGAGVLQADDFHRRIRGRVDAADQRQKVLQGLAEVRNRKLS